MSISPGQSAGFKLHKPYEPKGDQPEAIEKLSTNLKNGINRQTLLGVTGSGKTLTVANVIQQLQLPTLVISHNKTLAGQLYQQHALDGRAIRPARSDGGRRAARDAPVDRGMERRP